ncbi:MAG: hypothetical protein MUO97_10380 [Dehalococcoidia bacterium]|nr:hypothetical protein [Dehalococcoidia bacterium]
MTIAAGIKDIVQDIVSSREARVAEVKGLKKEANEMLGSFEASHKKMSAQLRQDLAQDKAKMRAEVKAMRSGLAQGAAARESEVNGMLKDFQGSRKQMGAQQRKELAQGVAVRKPEVHVMLNDFQSAHKQMGAQQRKLLADYDGSRQQMGAQQRKLRVDYYRGIKSEVAGMRQETIADLRKARTAWQALPSNGHAKGGGAEILPKWEALPHNVEAKLLAAVNEHPKGITLTEVADNLGIAPIVLGRASKSLLDKKLIRKKHKFYVPASAK